MEEIIFEKEQDMLDDIRDYMRSIEKDAISQLSVNCVIFGFHDKQLKVIVNKVDLESKAIYVLPGGYVKQEENLEDAVQRVVRESTGLEKILFKQFEVFGDAKRSFGKEFAMAGTPKPSDKILIDWLSQRFISICYLALVDFSKIEIKPTQFLEWAQWIAVDEGAKLSMDHSMILESARQTLVKELPYTPIASNLLPARFTLPELQSLVEAILGREIDRPNFRRKILKANILKKVGQDSRGKRRPADLYSFKNGKKTSLLDEYKFGF